MDINQINRELDGNSPGQMILQSYDIRDQSLIIAFTCDGGPKEDQAYVLRFTNTATFHLPSVVYAEVRFSLISTTQEEQQFIPAVNFDPGEFYGGGGGYSVFALTNRTGTKYGYYIAAESVMAEWKPRRSCLKVW